MRMQLDRYPIAIDLSDGLSAVALQLAPLRGEPAVRAALRRVVEPETDAHKADQAKVSFIKHVLNTAPFKGKHVVLLPPMDAVLSYPLRVEVAKQETLEAAIVREAEGALDAPLSEMMIDFASVRPDPSGDKGIHRVLLVASRKTDVERHVGLVKQAGGVLESIESVATALIRTYSREAALSAKPVVLCHVGRTHSAIVVATADGILAHRNVSWGTNGLIQKLIENIELGGKERDAEFLLRTHGVGQAVADEEDNNDTKNEASAAGPVTQLLVPLVDELIHELHNITGYVRSQTTAVAFGKLVIYGEGAHVEGLDRYMGRELGMNATALNPLQKIGMIDPHHAPAPTDGAPFSLALGLGMRRVRWL